MRVLRLEVSVYNVYITNQCQTTFARGEGGGGYDPLEEVTVNTKEENSKTFVPIAAKNSVSDDVHISIFPVG